MIRAIKPKRMRLAEQVARNVDRRKAGKVSAGKI
jgi:hypothetical protein